MKHLRHMSIALSTFLVAGLFVTMPSAPPARAMSADEILESVYSVPFNAEGDVALQAANLIAGQDIAMSNFLINGFSADVAREESYFLSFGVINNLRPVTGFDSGLIISADADIEFLSYDGPAEEVSSSPINGTGATSGSFAEAVQAQMQESYMQNAYGITSLEFTVEPTGPFLALDMSFISQDGDDGSYGDQAVIAAKGADDENWLDATKCLGFNDAPISAQYIGMAGDGNDSREDYALAQTNLVSFLAPYLRDQLVIDSYFDPSLTSPQFIPEPLVLVPPPKFGYEIVVPDDYTAQVSVGFTCILDVSFWYENDLPIEVGLGVANGDDPEVPPALVVREGSLGFVDAPTPIPLGMDVAQNIGYAKENDLVWVPGFAMVSEGDFIRFGDVAFGNVTSVEFGTEFVDEGEGYGVSEGTLGTLVSFSSNDDLYIPDPMSQEVNFGFNPYGPQVAVPASRLSGWTKCEENNFTEIDLNFDEILDACASDQIMMAAKHLDSPYISLLATSDFASFSTEKPVDDPELVNGTYWYFDRGLSVGFSLDETIEQDSCDVADESQSADYPEYRMCWRLYEDETLTSYLDDGFRMGAFEEDGGVYPENGDFVRQLYTLDLENFGNVVTQLESQIVAPFIIWVPADSPIPALDSRVNFSAGGGDYVDSAIVRSVASDYPFYCGEVEVCIAEEGELGFGIVLEEDLDNPDGFEGLPGPYNLNLVINATSQFYDSVYAESTAVFANEGLYGLWVHGGIDAANVSQVFSAWGGYDYGVVDVIEDTEYFCPPFVVEGDCSSAPTGSGTFLVFYENPPEEDLQLFIEDFDSGVSEEMILVGGRGQMQTDFNCEARSVNQSGEVFLGGQYLELGISETGSFGTLGDGPSFMRGNDNDNRIGMGADLDGYCSGIDAPIDYFLPGSEEERWSLGFIEFEDDLPRYISYAPVEDFNDEEDLRDYRASDSELSLFGVTENVSSADRLRSRTTVQIFDGEETIFEVLITHSFDPESRFYRSEYVVSSTSEDRDFFDVRFMRNVDPDNTVYQNEVPGDPDFGPLVDPDFDPYFTRNTILDQVMDGGTAQVQATAQAGDPFIQRLAELGLYTDVPLVFYSDDDRAVVSTGGFSEPNPYLISDESEIISSDSEVLSGDFDPVEQMQPTDFYVDCDCAIQMSATLGGIEGEDSFEPFTMYTSLDARDFSEVIEEVVEDDAIQNLLFPITPFTQENLFTAGPSSILPTGLTNVRFNNLSAEEFALLDEEDRAIAGAFGSFSGAQQFLGLDAGFIINPGYKADVFGFESQGDSTDEGFFDPQNTEAFLPSSPNLVNFDPDNPENSPIGALAKAVSLDSSVNSESGEENLFDPTSISFSMTSLDRYLKIDFVLGTTETATYDPESETWGGYATEFPDAVGIFIKDTEASWLDAKNCAAIPTTNSILSISNSTILPPGSPSQNRSIAESNYNDLVAITAKEGYRINPEAFVDRELTENEGSLLAPPAISLSNAQLGSVVKFVTAPMTCVVDLEELGLQGDAIEIGIAIANNDDPILPPALFVSANSIRFSSNQIAAPEAQVASVQEIAQLLPEIEIVPTLEEETPMAAPYAGPVIVIPSGLGPVPSGSVLQLSGTNLNLITAISLGDKDAQVNVIADSDIEITIPDLVPGDYSLQITSSAGSLTLQPAITVSAASISTTEVKPIIKRIGETQAKIWAKDLVGMGKVQFMVNGKEVAWVRASDESNPKLRFANGSHYLVRTIDLSAGKNVLEIFVDGERIRRVAYTN